MYESEQLVVIAHWDADAEVWVATSDDIPGLVAEAATQEEMIKELKVLLPLLLAENGVSDGVRVPPAFQLRSDQVVSLKVA